MRDDVLLSKPDILTARRMLVVQPHYDDNDIFAGGILAHLAENGTEIHYLTVTDDLVGVIDQSLPVEKMAAWLKDNQTQAGAIIGVQGQYWLGYPDAGQYDYFDVRRDIIQYMRMVRPDFVMTCDPWLPYEFHNDHIMTGKAATAAANLYGLTRLATLPEVDATFKENPFEIKGIAFYATAHPNTMLDITSVWDKKRQAVAQYTAQFSEEDMTILQMRLEHAAQLVAADAPFAYGEALKVMHTWQLHGFADAWKV